VYVKELVMKDFRNYQHQQLVFSPALTLLTGGNAQGKTNVLEAIYLLATGRSHRTQQDGDLVRNGQTGFCIGAVLDIGGSDRILEFSFNPGDGRRFSVGARNYRRVDSMYSGLHAVLFAPEDLDLIKGPPSSRRRFLDDEVFQGSSVYRKANAAYHRCLAQRNRLLRDAKGQRLTSMLLEPWNQQLSESGAVVTRMRRQVLKALSPVVGRVQERLTAGQERLELTYLPSGSDDPEEFLSALVTRLPEEQARGITLVGPHRDELAVDLDGKSLRTHGSQGQQRCVVLALKTAVMEHLHATTGTAPVLLLDDILSELDEERRSQLMGMLDNGSQTIVTSASHPWSYQLVEPLPVVYEIAGGIARRHRG